MSMTDNFTSQRIKNQKYTNIISQYPLQRYKHHEGWIDNVIGKELIFSHRNTFYTTETFTEKFHMHNYYEIILYIKGNVEYINENTVITPSPYTVIWFKPGQMHTGKLLSASQYERYVLYLSTDFFSINNQVTPMIDFIVHSAGTHMALSGKKTTELLELLKKVESITKTDKPFAELVLKSLLIEFFYILDSEESNVLKGENLTENISKIKHYIDTNYSTITSIADVADRFFYSREHISRKFMQTFNISMAQYLSKRRITESLALLKTKSVADVAYTVGFHSQSAFINAFKKEMNCLPSEYKSKFK